MVYPSSRALSPAGASLGAGFEARGLQKPDPTHPRAPSFSLELREYLLSTYCVPGTGPATGELAVNQQRLYLLDSEGDR